MSVRGGFIAACVGAAFALSACETTGVTAEVGYGYPDSWYDDDYRDRYPRPERPDRPDRPDVPVRPERPDPPATTLPSRPGGGGGGHRGGRR